MRRLQAGCYLLTTCLVILAVAWFLDGWLFALALVGGLLMLTPMSNGFPTRASWKWDLLGLLIMGFVVWNLIGSMSNKFGWR